MTARALVLVSLAWSMPAAAQASLPPDPSGPSSGAAMAGAYMPPTTEAPTGYWAAAGLDFLAARAIHPYVRLEGGLPITRSISIQVPVFLAEGRRDFYDWDQPDYDWVAAAVVPGLLVERTVVRWDGHYVTVGGDIGAGIHVLRANLPVTGENLSIGGLVRATALVRVVLNTGVLVHVAPLGLGLLAESDQRHVWYEGSVLVGFRWP